MKKGAGEKSNDAYNYGNGLKKINVYFPVDEYEQLCKIAEENKISKSKMIRLACNRDIKNYLSHVQIIDCSELFDMLKTVRQDLVDIRYGLTLQALELKRLTAERITTMDYKELKKASDLIEKIGDRTIENFDKNELDIRITFITTTIEHLDNIKLELFRLKSGDLNDN